MNRIINKKFVSTAVVLILVLLPLQVCATGTVVDPYANIPMVDGETSVGLQVVENSTGETLSFEVPLYITSAIVDTEEEVLVPNNYGITNLSVDNYGKGVDMAVVAIETTAHATTGYWEFIDGVAVDDNQMYFTVGGIPITVEYDETIMLDLTDSIFYDSSTEKFQVIEYQEYLNIPILGKVKAALRTSENGEQKAVAQFSLKYTVSLLDGNQNPVGVLYEGSYPDGYISDDSIY